MIHTELAAAARRLALVLALSSGLPAPAGAQASSTDGLPESLGLPRGALVFHGNYCGPGDRGVGLPPIDALDRACMIHDACSPGGGELPTCGCNDRLYRAATAVAVRRTNPLALRETALMVARGALLLPCR